MAFRRTRRVFRRRRPVFKRHMRRPLRRRAPRRKSAPRSGNFYRRRFFLTDTLTTAQGAATFSTQKLVPSDNASISATLDQFTKYRVRSLFWQAKPRLTLPASLFNYRPVQVGYAATLYDPNGELGELTSFESIINSKGGRQHRLTSIVRRVRMPVAAEQQTTIGGGTPIVNSSPWYNTSDGDVNYHICRVAIPGLADQSAAPANLDYDIKIWVDLEFSGRRPG